MNKFSTVLGVAAIVTLAGCKDPDYKYANKDTSQDEVKYAEAVPAESVTPAKEIAVAPAAKCMCLPGTKHTAPCGCGDADCKCVVDVLPPPPAPVAKPAPVKPAPKAAGTGYGIYIVQKGDVLSRIAIRNGLRVADIRTANPRIKKDIIWPGMKLRLPGKGNMVAPKAAAKAPVAPKAVAKKPVALAKKVPYAPYTGATKIYVVKAGDTVGSIAYANGLSIRQFKELNGLKKDVLRVGQKMKIPTQKVVQPAVAKPDAKKADAAKKPAAAATPAPAADAVKPADAPKAPEAAAVPAPAAPAADAAKPAEASAQAAPAAPASTATYVVQEGDDMTGVSIRWGVSAAAIRELNNLADDAQLVPGQILKLPADAQQ